MTGSWDFEELSAGWSIGKHRRVRYVGREKYQTINTLTLWKTRELKESGGKTLDSYFESGFGRPIAVRVEGV